MNHAILYPEVQKFIRKNQKTDLVRLVLAGSPFPEVTAQELAVQIAALNIAEKKIPTWHKTKNIIFPPKLNLEQTSSETTAKYKASLVQGKEMTDLTGGFGIDAYFFAENFEKLTYCELNSDLVEIVRHNFESLRTKNVEVITGDGLQFLAKTNTKFDWIYLDPARRDDHGGKVFRLADCTPDVPANLDLLFAHTSNIMLKTSPLLDLNAGISELKNVSEVHIVSVNNEVKELLWLLKKNPPAKIKIKTLNFLRKEIQKFEALFIKDQAQISYSLPRKFLYEPNPAIMKSRLFEELAQKTGTSKLHPNSHLFTSEELLDFPGRVLEIIDIKPFNSKILKKELKFEKGNITTRNFPDSVEKIRKKLKIKEGGNVYLFFTTNLKEEKIVIICRKKSLK